jgi:predicted metal-dependent peptidase
MAFHELNPEQRLVAVHTDMMRHPVFCILGGVTQIGAVAVVEDIPTAATDGVNAYYSRAFIMPMTRKQLRYLVAHENMHKALHHCTEYAEVEERFPQICGMAMDYVINGTLEHMDNGAEKFLERPTSVPPLVDPRFDNMSVPEVIRELVKDAQQKPQSGSQQGKQGKPTLDKHVMSRKSPENEAEMDAAKQKIDDAVRHGEIVQKQLQSMIGGEAQGLAGFRERVTDWRTPLRRFIQELCEGDDQSRFCPPNKRLLPLDILLPSHFSEATGELIVACDTSGSMTHVLPMVFGEVARICQQVQPVKVRVLWWDTQVRSEQVFTVKDYPNIAKLQSPRGGGGTTVSCVARYIREKRLKPKATVMLSDGYIESSYEVPAGNVLWGIVDHPSFVPLRGKMLHIRSE